MIIPDIRSIAISAVTEFNNYYYAASALLNCIYKIDCSDLEVVDSVAILEEENTTTRFSYSIRTDDSIIFFPHKGKGICILNPERFEYEYVSLYEYCERRKLFYNGLSGIQKLGDKVLLFPRSVKQPFMEYNIKEKRIELLIDINDSIRKCECLEDGLFSIDSIRFIGGRLYILFGENQSFLSVNLSDGMIREYKLPADEYFRGFFYRNDSFYFYSQEGLKVYEWDFEHFTKYKNQYEEDEETLYNSIIRVVELRGELFGLSVGTENIYFIDSQNKSIRSIRGMDNVKRKQPLFCSGDLLPSFMAACSSVVFPCGVDRGLIFNDKDMRSFVLKSQLNEKIARDYYKTYYRDYVSGTAMFEDRHLMLEDFIRLL